MYLRFIIEEIDSGSTVPTGIYQAAAKLSESGKLSESEARSLQEIRDWINSHLPRPDRFNKTTSKGYYRRPTKGISWLKNSAEDYVAKFREMTLILEEHGIQTRMITTNKPGYIVYEDEFQIVAEPFSDTNTG